MNVSTPSNFAFTLHAQDACPEHVFMVARGEKVPR